MWVRVDDREVLLSADTQTNALTLFTPACDVYVPGPFPVFKVMVRGCVMGRVRLMLSLG